jgi:subtilase family serine protease
MSLRKFRSLFALLLCIVPFSLLAQVSFPRPVARITQAINGSSASLLKGSVHPLTTVYADAGHADGSQPMEGMTISFSPSAQQRAALKALLVAQQTPSSPQYHQWLTPAEYASAFGMAPSDVAAVSSWLQQQGFQILSSSPLEVKFSGTVTQVESAFHTRIDNYNVNGNMRRANATEISLPSVLQGMVSNVRGLNEFRPRPRVRLSPAPHYTVSTTAGVEHFVTPADFTTLYDVAPLYNAGYTGTGETIAIVGQSEILASDIANFRSAAGLPANAPILTLMPGTGSAQTNSGDEMESDLDVEWSGAVARNATINFVYVGNNQSYDVFDAMEYVIQNDLAPVISTSYGLCEQEWPSADITQLETDFQEANAQGQTILAAAGDDGAADCDDSSNPNKPVTSATHGYAVDYPGSSAYVTSVGGTEFSGDVSSPGTYWNSSNTSGAFGEDSSAIQYIPAEVWNDTTAVGSLDAGGGGASTLFTKPTWQTGTGVPADGHRDVPDIALNASNEHDGYVLCSSANSSTDCSNGFANAQDYLDIAGGTSFAAPSFAGILTLINERQGVTGQGNFNPAIYAAANSSNYATAFHDVTTGNNDVPCTAGSTDCGSSGEIGYSATPGFDLASGWGAIDAYNFGGTAGVLPVVSGTVGFSVGAGNVSVAPGATGSSTITVTPVDGFTGSVAFTVTPPSNLTGVCFSVANATVSGTSPTTTALTVTTSSASCSSATTAKLEPLQPRDRGGERKGVMEAGAMLLSLLFLGIPAVRRKRGLWVVLLLIGVGSTALTGCGSSGAASSNSGSSSSSGTGTSSTGTSTTGTSTTGATAAGTYTVTVTGTDSASHLTASTVFTLTVS